MTRALTLDKVPLELTAEELQDVAAHIESVGPGDVIVVELLAPMSDERVGSALTYLSKVWPNNKVVFCPSDMRFKVARAAQPKPVEHEYVSLTLQHGDYQHLNGTCVDVLRERATAVVNAELRADGLYATVPTLSVPCDAGPVDRIECQWLRYPAARASHRFPSIWPFNNQISLDFERFQRRLVGIHG